MIDRKLIELHQWIVDSTEKKPRVWAEQMGYGYTVTSIVHEVLKWESGWDAVLLLLALVVGAGMVIVSKNEVALKGMGQSTWIRPFLLAMNFVSIVTLIMGTKYSSVLGSLSGVLMLSYYYFAVCENPRPKKRKEKLVLKTAS